MNQPLAETIFWVAALACVVAEIAILRSTFAARRVQRSALVPASPRSGEIAWAIIPVFGLAAVLVLTWQQIEARNVHMRMMHHSGMDQSMPMPGMNPAPTTAR